MKRVCIHLDVRSEKDPTKFIFNEAIEGDTLGEVLGKLLIYISMIEKKLAIDSRMIDDDIPF